MRNIKLLFVILFPVIISCSSSEVTVDNKPKIDNGGIENDSGNRELNSEDVYQLIQTRSELSDRFATINSEIPEIFTREVIEETREIDEYAGFRVQILSTRDIVHADSTKDDFRAWADSTFVGFAPDAYVSFRPPYYRVQAGDFRNRDRAIEFSRKIKWKYPDAWVVHDRINPVNIPADSVKFETR